MKFISKRLPALRMKLVLPSFGVLALVIFSSIILFEATKATVVFAENGEEQTVKTHAKTVEELLDELGIEVGEHDSISVHLDENLKNGLIIEYNEAKRVYVTIDDVTYKYYTTKETVEDLFEEKSLQVTDRDDMSHDVEQTVYDDLHVFIQKAFQVVIDDGGKARKVWSTGTTVQQLLNEHKIDLNELDVVEPALDENIAGDQFVSITRVEKKTKEIEEVVSYQTEKKDDSSLTKGKQRTVTQGKNGTLVKKYEVIYENGKEKDRKLIGEEVVAQPVNKVVAIGTKVEQPKQNLVTLSQPSSKGEPSGEVLYMRASAYTANCNGCSGITRTGINLKNNPNMKVIAVDPSVIPLGSKVWVEGYGYAVAGDTGGAIRGNTIDIHVPTRSEALRFGIRNVKVIVIK